MGNVSDPYAGNAKNMYMATYSPTGLPFRDLPVGGFPPGLEGPLLAP